MASSLNFLAPRGVWVSSRKGWVGVWSSKRTYEVEMCPLASPQQLMMLSAERRQQGDTALSWHDCHRAICTSFAGQWSQKYSTYLGNSTIQLKMKKPCSGSHISRPNNPSLELNYATEADLELPHPKGTTTPCLCSAGD